MCVTFVPKPQDEVNLGNEPSLVHRRAQFNLDTCQWLILVGLDCLHQFRQIEYVPHIIFPCPSTQAGTVHANKQFVGLDHRSIDLEVSGQPRGSELGGIQGR